MKKLFLILILIIFSTSVTAFSLQDFLISRPYKTIGNQQIPIVIDENSVKVGSGVIELLIENKGNKDINLIFNIIGTEKTSNIYKKQVLSPFSKDKFIINYDQGIGDLEKLEVMPYEFYENKIILYQSSKVIYILTGNEQEISSQQEISAERTNIGLMPIPTEQSNTYVYANGKLIEKIDENNQFRYYHSDNIGSTSIVTDDAGVIVYSSNYSPFGSSFNEQGTDEKYKFTGKEKDSSSGLYYYGARYYDLDTGRFTQIDPIQDYSSSSYAYVSNNPLTRIDPSGMEAGTSLNELDEWGRLDYKRRDEETGVVTEGTTYTRQLLPPSLVIPIIGPLEKPVLGVSGVAYEEKNKGKSGEWTTSGSAKGYGAELTINSGDSNLKVSFIHETGGQQSSMSYNVNTPEGGEKGSGTGSVESRDETFNLNLNFPISDRLSINPTFGLTYSRDTGKVSTETSEGRDNNPVDTESVRSNLGIGVTFKPTENSFVTASLNRENYQSYRDIAYERGHEASAARLAFTTGGGPETPPERLSLILKTGFTFW